jgi:hypothetical protein
MSQWVHSTSGGRAVAGKHIPTREYHAPCELTSATREWDVAAGICLLKEAGGLVTTANPPADMDGAVPDTHLGSRLYLAIRPAGDSATETGRQTQERTVREVWRRVDTLDYSRPGV